MNNQGREPDGMPRWVWILLLGFAAATVLVIVIMMISGGEHGPARHSGSGQAVSGTQLALLEVARR